RTMAGEHLFPDVQERTTFGFYNATLTQREIQILHLVCQNLSYQEIADRLQLTRRTVSFHISNMLSKTGHKSLVGLAVEAAEKGYAGRE
ncbi:response regulator transcription factor, partial [Acidaminococcus timonensis]